MDDKELYQGFAPEKQAEYEAWLVDRYGGDMQERIDASKAQMKSWTKGDVAAFQGEGAAIEQAFAKALADGLPLDSEPVQALARRWAGWVERAWGRRPTREAFTGLGQLYQQHPDFTARYEALGAGLTDYLAEAMRVFAERELA